MEGIQADIELETLLTTLRRNLTWVDRAHLYWLEDRPREHTDQDFSEGLARVDEGERLLRTFEYSGCVMGEGPCVPTSPYTCDWCQGYFGPPVPDGHVWVVPEVPIIAEGLPALAKIVEEESIDWGTTGSDEVVQEEDLATVPAGLESAPTIPLEGGRPDIPGQMSLFNIPVEEANATNHNRRGPPGRAPARRARGR